MRRSRLRSQSPAAGHWSRQVRSATMKGSLAGVAVTRTSRRRLGHASIYPKGTDEGTRPPSVDGYRFRHRSPVPAAPTGYELVHDGRRYPPKAVIWAGLPLAPWPDVAAGRVQRRPEAPGQANFVLRELGFLIEEKGSDPTRVSCGGHDRKQTHLVS